MSSTIIRLTSSQSSLFSPLEEYLSFNSHHPLHQKLGVIRTLLDRCQNIVTDDKDKEIEEIHITEARKDVDTPGGASIK